MNFIVILDTRKRRVKPSLRYLACRCSQVLQWFGGFPDIIIADDEDEDQAYQDVQQNEKAYHKTGKQKRLDRHNDTHGPACPLQRCIEDAGTDSIYVGELVTSLTSQHLLANLLETPIRSRVVTWRGTLF